MEDSIIVAGQKDLTYSKYLKIDELLSLQQPLTEPAEHDEMLFIIIHQVYELWFKQLHHELDVIIKYLDKGVLMRVLSALKRLDAIQKVMIQQVDVLETMACDDFARFRKKLAPASGFQSFQFRCFEFRLGLKDPRYFQYYADQPRHQSLLESYYQAPTAYDAFLSFLANRGYSIPPGLLHRDCKKAHPFSEELVDLFVKIYQHPYDHSEVYYTLEALLDLDEGLTRWRYRHVAMVERMIGTKTGTGGSSGAKYLHETLAKRCFPEIWAVRNRLQPGGER